MANIENNESFSFLDVVDAPKEDATEAAPAKVKKPRAPRKAKVAAVPDDVAPESVHVQSVGVEHDEPAMNSAKPKTKPKKRTTKPADIEITDEEKAEAENKQTLVMTVLRYQESARFADYLKKQGLIYKAEKLNKMDAADLKEILVRVRFCLGNRGAGSMIDELVKGGMTGAEALISVKTKYKITGMTQICFSDDEWLDCFELCKLEYISFGYIRPELRLMLSTFRIATACHVMNTDENLKKQFDSLNMPNAGTGAGANAGTGAGANAAIDVKRKAKTGTKLKPRANNIEPDFDTTATGPSVSGVKQSNSAEIGRASNLVEPEFD